MGGETIHYRLGLPEAMRRQAALLYDQAFIRKFGPIIKDPAKRVELIEAAIVPQLAVVALRGNQLAGVAGFHGAKTCFAGNWRFVALRRSLGLGRAVRAMALLSLFDHNPQKDELLVDAIAVDAGCRGRGIGSGLLERLDELARSKGLSAVRLEVIQGNDGAERLFRRNGFEVTERCREPLLGLFFDFRGYATMVKRV